MTFWNKLSDREQRLALITGVSLVLAVLGIGTMRSLAALDDMDLTIAQLEQDLVFYSEQAMIADDVDRQYGTMAEQHSSAWTEEEIHDRLRREIARLALREPVADVGEDQPSGDQLVEIRQMPRGVMDASGQGYRAYQVSFRTEPTDIRNLVVFMERLMESPQALRIDSLMLKREPLEKLVTAQFTVTRTVIASRGAETATPDATAPVSAPGVNLAVNGGFESWDTDASAFAHWQVDGCEASVDAAATEGQQAGRFTALHSDATVQMGVEVPGGATLSIAFDASATGAARVEVRDSNTGQGFDGAMALEADGSPYHYAFTFPVPQNGESVSLAAPVIVLEEADASVILDNVVVQYEAAP